MRAAAAADGERSSAGAAAGPAYEVAIAEPRPAAARTVVRLLDRGATVTYRLGARGKGHRWAFGFTEYSVEADGNTSRTPVSAAEVMAIARVAGREHEVVEMVEAALPYVTPRNA